MRGVSVVIAGAGLAGLTAARDLTKKGALVTVDRSREDESAVECSPRASHFAFGNTPRPAAI